MKTDEQERYQTATQEIEKARRRIAKCVNDNLDGVVRMEDLLTLTTILERIR